MSARKMTRIYGLIAVCLLPLSGAANTNDPTTTGPLNPLGYSPSSNTLASQLGWVPSTDNSCGGYYLEQPFVFPVTVEQNNSIEVTSNHGLISNRGTSILEGKVTLTRAGQQITSNKAYVFRDAEGKPSAMEMIGNVNLREPNTLVVGKKGRYSFTTKTKSLMDILYRTTLSGHEIVGPNKVTPQEMQQERKITALTAWGKAYEFSSTEPRIYELSRTSFSTCPPTNPAWRVKASHIVLNKNTGRGYATNARIYVKSIPIFYFPYLNFSIDGQRKSGFLWPSYGGSNQSGPSLYAPFYWNMAPNYDMTITPALLTKRGVQVSNNFRYLSHTGSGNVTVGVLPNDKLFSDFQTAQEEQYRYSTDPITQAELNRLINASTTRKSLIWRDDSRFSPHWSSHVDFNYAGDDYYMRNFGNLNQISQNQLLQEGDLYYKNENWNFTGRVQSFQTLHPVDEVNVTNAYRRFPQLILNADYPEQPFGLEYFINNEVTHFEILNNPGASANQTSPAGNVIFPVGNRLHTQPGISLPLNWTSFYVDPRIQLALSDYNLNQTVPTDTPNNIQRAVPIFDVLSGMSFERDTGFFHHAYQQTLEPQVYYTYIPYRNQSSIPVFDTTVNTLSYDAIFNYNRFSGIDRIGDANQVGVGVTTRFIDQETGLEKIRAGLGEIVYFANRNVTLCDTNKAGVTGCTDNQDNHSNFQRLSPLTGLLNYNVNPHWSVTDNTIWNPISKQLDNTTIALHYQPDEQRIINLGYNFARDGDVLSGVIVKNGENNNLKSTDFSFAWPVFREVSAVGRWTEDWNLNRLQNLLYGLQYDSCCWAIRLVGGRAFTNLDPNNQPIYNNEVFIQFALKGLGNVGNANPSGLLNNSISGYKSQFGQEN